MLKIEIVQQDHEGRTQCAICLLPCDLAPAMLAVRGGESEYVILAETPYICLRCVYGGVDHMIRELRNRADSSRLAATQLDRWADEGIEVPPDLQAVIGSEQSWAWLLGGEPPAMA